MYKKTYVEVTARFDEEGKIIPIKILWNDGRTYRIDKVLNICRAASLKAGGAGIRYTCQIGKNQRYLFLEENRWFVEEVCSCKREEDLI